MLDPASLLGTRVPGLSTLQLKRFVFTSEDYPPRTSALETKIQIGSGYHQKWYRSQKEHWLAWILVQEVTAEQSGKPLRSVDCRGMWGRLKCSPMMYWLGEAAGVSDTLLHLAEVAAVNAAKINPKDGHPHGKLMRQVLPWQIVAEAINTHERHASETEAIEASKVAFQRLTDLRPEFRRLKTAQEPLSKQE